MEPQARQRKVQAALDTVLDIRDGEVLTAWVVVYEVVAADGSASVAWTLGPEGTTPWRAIGLIEWADIGSTNEGDED